MKTVLSAIAICVCFASCLSAGAIEAGGIPSKALMKRFSGGEQPPDDLYDAYAVLVKAIGTADQTEIRKHLLPGSIDITTEERPEKYRDRGKEMNMPFLKRGFNKDIISVRKNSDDTYLIRTGTSSLFFVRTRSEGWKVYRYIDVPLF
jgi:hypothetical protein